MSIHQKQIESANLSAEVEQWLAQNAVKSLPMGFTHFPDGKLPIDRSRTKESNTERLEKERIIAERNEAVRKQKEADKASKLAEQLKRQQDREKWKAETPEQKVKRRRNYQAAYRERQRKKHIEFVGPPKPKKPRHPVSERCRINRIGRDEAIKNGVLEFVGQCLNCGTTKFVITNLATGTTCCVACRQKRDRRRREPTKPLSSDKRILFNRKQKAEALTEGAEHFQGECLIHGLTKFEITSQHGYVCHRCVECRREVNRKRRRKAKGEGCE